MSAKMPQKQQLQPAFNAHPGTDNGKYICELNNKTRKMKPSDFKKKKGSNYYGSMKVSYNCFRYLSSSVH